MTEDITEINISEVFVAKASKFVVTDTKFRKIAARKSWFE